MQRNKLSAMRRLAIVLLLGGSVTAAAAFPPPHTGETTATQAPGKHVGTMVPVPPPRPNLRGATAAPAAASAQPGAALAAGQNFAFFDSGEQQCQLGNYKIIYHYFLEPVSNLADHPGAVWAMRYELRSEYRNSSGWHPDNGLYAFDWSITYQGGQKPAEGTRDTRMQGQGQVKVAHAFAWGNDWTPIASVSLIISRSGGAHGMHKTWSLSGSSQGNACDPG